MIAHADDAYHAQIRIPADECDLLLLRSMAIVAAEARSGLHVILLHAEQRGHRRFHRFGHELHHLWLIFIQLLESLAR